MSREWDALQAHLAELTAKVEAPINLDALPLADLQRELAARWTPDADTLLLPKSVGTDSLTDSSVTSDKLLHGTAAPVSGAWTQGNIVWNSAPAASGKIGFVCVVSGTPGTWKAFGPIDA